MARLEEAVKAWRDFTLTQAIILLSALSYLVINLAVDVLYAWLDPRVEIET
jgi:ABC-type dipeptide/oligopeptide/nickel transport system permease component